MSKYYSQKTTVDGITFDSRKEASRYCELKILERARVISDLQMQVKYVLIPAQYASEGKKRKCIERECSYIADFVYYDWGQRKTIVEDVKGYRDPSSAAYGKYTIKRKLMLEKYGIRITEV